MRCLLLLFIAWVAALAGPVRTQAQQSAATGYRVETPPCWADGPLKSRSFRWAGRAYTVRYAEVCLGPPVLADTVAAPSAAELAALGDSADARPVILRYAETGVRVLLISAAGTKEVVIRKDTFRRELGREKEWPKLGLGTTTLRRVDARTGRVEFETFLGYAFSDVGVLLRYAVDTQGRVHFRGLADAPEMP